mmetsp:Transcript_5482/g.16835  ORF Transcript_5482/g.16835 Transcript_5482/m.16835 type:complete len:86 (+) Transcript_5482:298-555(+)
MHSSPNHPTPTIIRAPAPQLRVSTWSSTAAYQMREHRVEPPIVGTDGSYSRSHADLASAPCPPLLPVATARRADDKASAHPPEAT